MGGNGNISENVVCVVCEHKCTMLALPLLYRLHSGFCSLLGSVGPIQSNYVE